MDIAAANRTIDALRLTAQDLDICIDSMRKKMRRGREINRKTYPDLIRRAYELREAAEAYGFHGPLVELVEPMPYRTQLTGRTREEVKAIEWIGAGDFWGGRTVNTSRRIAA